MTSESTEDYDRGEKLENYKQIPGLGAVVLVSHRERRIDVVERAADGQWRQSTYGRGAVVPLVVIDARLSVDAVYAALPG